jgi:hypothetical protein
MNWGDVNGSTHLRQTLSGGYTPKTQYELSFDAAGFRWGPATAFRVRIIDDSTTHVSTGSLDSAPLTSFTHFSYVFTSPSAFDGPPVIRLENLTAGNVGVDFANVALIPVTLSITNSGSNLQLNWTLGTLLEANEVTGPWTANGATSPYLVTPTEDKKFYRVLVR